MSRPLGKHQVRTLIMLGSPSMLLLNPDKVAASLIKRGLCQTDRPDGSKAVRITPAGLRALADEMESGRVDQIIDEINREGGQ